MIDEHAIRQRWEAVGCKLDERGRRLFAAGEVRTAGWGGLAVVSKITGLARSTINRGADDLDAEPLPKGRVRRAGGGRRAVCETGPGLVPALERLVAPAMLLGVKGIGPEFAAVLWSEGLSRPFENRRQIAAYAGLAPTPWQSGRSIASKASRNQAIRDYERR